MDNLTNSSIQQFTTNYNAQTKLIYTLIDDGKQFELWLHVAGYGKAVMLYGGLSKELLDRPLNLDYCINKELIKELTHED